MLEASSKVWGGGGLREEERSPLQSACCGPVPCLGFYVPTRNSPPPSGAGGGQAPHGSRVWTVESSSSTPPTRRPGEGTHGICITCQVHCENSLNLDVNLGGISTPVP